MKPSLFVLLFFSTVVHAGEEFALRLRDIQKKHELPGLAALIQRNDVITELEATGVRKLGAPELLSTENKFHIGSCTKAMTATLIATFIEEGKLNWSDTLAELFPDVKVDGSFSRMTLGELLTHRAGLMANPDDELDEKLSDMELITARKTLSEVMLSAPAAQTPGSKLYSNVGYIMAGSILERISGKSWEMLINERIFSPLGMTSCGFGPLSDPDSSVVLEPWGHYKEDGVIRPYHFDNFGYYGPAGTVHCRLSDWNKFATLHMKAFQGHPALLTAESFKKLHTSYPSENETYTFGGWNRIERGWASGTVLTHTGSNVVDYATVWIAPKMNSLLLTTTNLGKAEGLAGLDDVIDDWIAHTLKP